MVVSSIETLSTQSKVSLRGKRVEHGAGALADRHLVAREVDRSRDRGDRLALGGVARRVHADEAAALHVGWLVLDLDAAELRGIRGVIELHGHDVVVARHRPVGSVAALGAVVNRCLASQPREQRLPGVLLVDGGIADVDRVERLRQVLAPGKGCGRHGLPPGVRALRRLLVEPRYYRNRSTGKAPPWSGMGACAGRPARQITPAGQVSAILRKSLRPPWR